MVEFGLANGEQAGEAGVEIDELRKCRVFDVHDGDAGAQIGDFGEGSRSHKQIELLAGHLTPEYPAILACHGHAPAILVALAGEGTHKPFV